METAHSANVKLGALTFILLQFLFKFGVEGNSATSPVDGGILKIHFRSHRNATNYRILRAQVETSSNAARDKLFVNITQSEIVVQNVTRLIFDIETAVPARTTVNNGYEFFPGFGHYKLYTFPLLWPEAKAACEADGAHLVVMDTAAESEVVKAFFARKPTFPGASHGDYVSIGVNDIDKENHFVTVTGKDLNSLELKTVHASGGRGENYVCVDAKGAMHDFPLTWKLGYICEAYQS